MDIWRKRGLSPIGRIASSNRSGRIAYGQRQRGLSVIGWLLMIPAALIVLLILVIGFYEGRKAYWDSKVREMCAKDGGVQIFERIIISKAEADVLPKAGGFLGMATEALAKPSEPAYLRVYLKVLRDDKPAVQREEQQVVRRSDSRIVGRVVRYGRGGGDFPTYAHPSTYSCPDYVQIYRELQEVYRIEEMK